MEVVVEDTVSEGDKVAARCTVRGRHRGDSLGFKATDSPVAFDGICIVRIRGGKIVEAWNNFDFMSMFRQLGALRLDAGPPASDQDDALPSLD
jgi:predicted ester cyclase